MAQINQLHQLLTRMARNRHGYILDAATVERVCNRWCDRHAYRYGQMARYLFKYGFKAWIFDPEYGHGHMWDSRYAPIDIPLEPPMDRCVLCGEPIWHEYPRRCDKRACRAVYAFYYYGNCWPRSAPQGDRMGLYLVSDFLRRMSRPKNSRELEFSKRYVHRALREK